MAKIKKVDDDASESAGFSAADYNHVAKNAQLEGIKLLTANFDLKPEHLSQRDEWNLGYDIDVISSKYDAEKNYCAAIIRYTVFAKVKRAKALKCVAEYGVFYSMPEVAEPQAAEGFCHNVGMFAGYPYFRALAANLAWNAGVDLPPMPSIASTSHVPRS